MMRIYLIGYMGSGKSSVGKKLAHRMNYAFLDLDEYLENDQKKSVSELFAEKGEAAFRMLERMALHHTFSLENCIISTGGGTPVYFDNIDLMKKHGLCIYLKASIDVVLNRLQHHLDTRPLLAKLSKEELAEFIQNQLIERSPFYEKATIHIDAKNLTPAQLHQQINLWKEASNSI